MSYILDALRWIGILFLVLMLFNLVIVVHEWGHFLAARWRGLKVEKFQIWFGKPIWKRTYNGVQYGLGTIPFGGFVALPQMADMTAIEGASATNPDGTPVEKLAKITPLDKIIVAFAGPLFSFLLAIVFAFIVWGVGKPVMQSEKEAMIGYVDSERPAGAPNGLKVGDKVTAVDGEEVKSFSGPVNSVMWAIVSAKNEDIVFDVVRDGQPLKVTINAPTSGENAGKEFKEWANASWWSKIWNRPPMRRVGILYAVDNIAVDKMLPNSPVELAGFKAGDILRTVNGQRVLSTLAIVDAVKKNPTGALKFEVERDGKLVPISVTAAKPTKPSDYKGEGELGFDTFKDADEERRKLDGSNIQHPTPYDQIHDSLQTTFSTLGALFSKSKVEAGHMSSAIGIISIYHKLFDIPNGWMLILFFTVVLNVNLAVLNMLPIPVLDGGHITMALIEGIGGRPLRGKIVEYIQAGFAVMLLSFMFWVMLKDVGSMKPEKSEPIEFSAPGAPEAK
jgi:regulator of sigma E protease